MVKGIENPNQIVMPQPAKKLRLFLKLGCELLLLVGVRADLAYDFDGHVPLVDLIASAKHLRHSTDPDRFFDAVPGSQNITNLDQEPTTPSDLKFRSGPVRAHHGR
jgi:hypothetical protein